MADWNLKEGEKLVSIYSKLDGKPLEVPSDIHAELEAFEASARGQVLANYSAKPLSTDETQMGMMRLGRMQGELDAREQATKAAAEAEAERKALEVPYQNYAKGSDWSGLVN